MKSQTLCVLKTADAQLLGDDSPPGTGGTQGGYVAGVDGDRRIVAPGQSAHA
jgi:hypothetical protein